MKNKNNNNIRQKHVRKEEEEGVKVFNEKRRIIYKFLHHRTSVPAACTGSISLFNNKKEGR